MVTKDETYHFLSLKFKVFPLWCYAQQELNPHRISLGRIAKFYGFAAVGSKNKMSMFSINADYAKGLSKQDLKQPILLVKLGNESGGIMIDGLHRAYNLWKKGQKSVRAYYITDRRIISKHSNIQDFKLK